MTNKLPSSAETESTPLPDTLFTQIVPQIQDIAELKVTLYIFYLLHRKQTYPRFVCYRELLPYSTLMGMEEEVLRHALSLALKRGTILRATLDIDGNPEEAYFINTKPDKELIEGIKSKAMPEENIFTLYEQNIGVITPMIAEELKEAEKLYPSQWIRDAFKEAVALNKRRWRYISRILERWAIEGKEGGENRPSIKKGGPNKYIRGKYGHLVKR